MARVTVEDCIDKVDSPYQLVLVAKERVTQLNSGVEPSLPRDNDKNTVISLREIAEEKVKVTELVDIFAKETGLQRTQVEKEVMQLIKQLNEGGLLVIPNQGNAPNVDFKKSN